MLEVAAHEQLLVTEPPIELTHREVVRVVAGHDLGDPILRRPADGRELREPRQALAAQLRQHGCPLVFRAPALAVDEKPRERHDPLVAVEHHDAPVLIQQPLRTGAPRERCQTPLKCLTPLPVVGIGYLPEESCAGRRAFWRTKPATRSEERRVGKEGRSRWWPEE